MTSPFFVKGQGVFLFKNPEKHIKIRFTDNTQKNIITLVIEDHVKIYCKGIEYKDPNNEIGIVHMAGAYYWISINAQTQQIYVGIGEPRLETVIYQCIISGEKKYMETLSTAHYDSSTNMWKVIKDPITRKVPLYIKNTDELTMSDIATSSYMPTACLSDTARKLYECISGKRFVLDDADFPDFSKAIEHSIATPGLWCHKKLKEKSREFNPNVPNLKETYLRITLGENSGESPGIPYVMEIWPPGHYSPVHSHAGASAVIRVLHGEIHVKLYPFLCAERDGVAPFGRSDFGVGDITWISPTLNQTHQLVNHKEETCITIQCYMYENANLRHYDYFDYLDDSGHKKQYEPDSDMDFVQFKERMKSEWESCNNI
jgi:hypothetical protein